MPYNTPTTVELEVIFSGKGTILNPFVCADNVPNNVSISQFLENLLNTPNNPTFLKVSAGSNNTSFVVKAFRDCNCSINFSIATDVGFNAAHPECLLDYRALEASIRLVAIPGFSMTESSSDGYENSHYTLTPLISNNPTINLGVESVPFLDTTVQFAES